MIKSRIKDNKDQTELSPDIARVCTSYIDRCYLTIEFLLKEYLGEEIYTLEYDKIFLEKDFEGRLVDKLYYLLDKVRSLTFLRDTLLSFLQKIDLREVRKFMIF